MSRPRPRAGLGRNGFTLLEVMIGLAILSGVIITVITSINYSLGTASYDRDLVAATVLGKDLAEQISLSGTAQDGEGTFPAPFARFSWSLEQEHTEVQGLERVKIKVSWEKDNDVTFVSFLRRK